MVAGNDCETFWDKDQLTDSCYQFNFQSTLSWREAWASCEQQGADLLSITEIHEQTYINGEPGGEAGRLQSPAHPGGGAGQPAPETWPHLHPLCWWECGGSWWGRGRRIRDGATPLIVAVFHQGSSLAIAPHCGLALMTWTPVEAGSGQTIHLSSTSTGRVVRHEVLGAGWPGAARSPIYSFPETYSREQWGGGGCRFPPPAGLGTTFA